jgi:two-component system OmpR family sensor kinase
MRSEVYLRRYWLPITLGLLSLLLLVRVFFAERFVLVPEDMDVVALVVLLCIAMIVAIQSIVRISMNHLRLRTMRNVRRAMLAEHRRFLSRLDHELKNPLTALRAGLQTLELTGLTPQQGNIIETMSIETLRLSRLVTALRKLVELEAQPLNLQPVHLATLVDQIIQLEQERFAANQRTLASLVEGDAEYWLLDEDLLALAVHNLLDNALKYSRPGDAVNLTVTAQQELVIRVSDNGIGIPVEALPHVWEELYRAHPEEKIPGSGAGLALVKAIVERHAGAVSVESEPGAGATFVLRLPALSQT